MSYNTHHQLNGENEMKSEIRIENAYHNLKNKIIKDLQAEVAGLEKELYGQDAEIKNLKEELMESDDRLNNIGDYADLLIDNKQYWQATRSAEEAVMQAAFWGLCRYAGGFDIPTEESK